MAGDHLVAEPADAAWLHRLLSGGRVRLHEARVVLRGAHLAEVEQLHAAIEAEPTERAHLLVRGALLLSDTDHLAWCG